MKTKLCIDCKNILPETDFYIHRNKADGSVSRASICKGCRKIYFKAYYSQHKKESLQRVREREKRAKIFVRNYLAAHPCVDCGEKDIVVLEFDHVRGKRFGIHAMVHAGYNHARILKEISKCEVRCANCHRRKHNGKFF